MNNSSGFAGYGFGGRQGQGPGSGGGFPGGGFPSGQGLWDAMDQLRTMFDQKVAPRMGRGDVRAAVLALLAEQPMHGYQIIQEISDRTGGSWKPSAGSVYPTLQLLADEGLIRAEEANGRKTYSLTDEGRAEADASEKPAPWETGTATPRENRGGPLAKAGMELAQAAAQVGRSGTPDQVTAAVDVLEDARRRLYSILAQD
ncbi:PadR family transcriptional regulator [Microbacterium fluvii]|uniref:PadR family transcriptional regulator n=1 Tax=Microbacterium fluvii TaxID=415215 RepID=A0ABW2HAE3_9MICO|nr:PadR family transcriptional regulator [Microbacterium fluvii]MCU4671670.1 PadR family transcriptional regulator [Microbacterium fluvii]